MDVQPGPVRGCTDHLGLKEWRERVMRSISHVVVWSGFTVHWQDPRYADCGQLEAGAGANAVLKHDGDDCASSFTCLIGWILKTKVPGVSFLAKSILHGETGILGLLLGCVSKLLEHFIAVMVLQIHAEAVWGRQHSFVSEIKSETSWISPLPASIMLVYILLKWNYYYDLEAPAKFFIIGEEQKAIFILLDFKRYKIEHTSVPNAVENALFDFFAFVSAGF